MSSVLSALETVSVDFAAFRTGRMTSPSTLRGPCLSMAVRTSSRVRTPDRRTPSTIRKIRLRGAQSVLRCFSQRIINIQRVEAGDHHIVQRYVSHCPNRGHYSPFAASPDPYQDSGRNHQEGPEDEKK